MTCKLDDNEVTEPTMALRMPPPYMPTMDAEAMFKNALEAHARLRSSERLCDMLTQELNTYRDAVAAWFAAMAAKNVRFKLKCKDCGKCPTCMLIMLAIGQD